MKENRQDKMLEIIRNYDVGTQEELAGRLREAGFSVTQATVSRDIRELKLSKVPTAEGGQKYVALEQEEGGRGDRFIRVLQDAFSSMATAQNLLVVRTVSGPPRTCWWSGQCPVWPWRRPPPWTPCSFPRWWAASPGMTPSSWPPIQ